VKIAQAPEEPYDYLVVATGAAYSFFGHAEWSRHCFVLKTLDDAIAIRGHLLAAFEWAENRTEPEQIRRLLTFVVVGGGPTGVELAGNIAELARSTLARDFRHINPATARVLLCESGARVLSEFPERLSRYADASLRSLGVEVRTGTEVNGIDATGLMAGSERIETVNIFWAAGTAARPAAKWLGVAEGRHGAVKVGPDCAAEGLKNVFVVGDVAIQLDRAGHPLPGLGAVAKQQGAYVGRLLAARVAGGREPGPFRYRDLGTLAIIGRSRAVAKLPGMAFTGWIAWLLWSLVHLVLLVDVRSKFAVYLNWSWTWFTNGRGARLIVGSPEEPPDSAGKPDAGGKHEEAA
jgi:NADH dehydrogenase